jgi:hypothetical protein
MDLFFDMSMDEKKTAFQLAKKQKTTITNNRILNSKKTENHNTKKQYYIGTFCMPFFGMHLQNNVKDCFHSGNCFIALGLIA